jgi:hypothetical protein
VVEMDLEGKGIWLMRCQRERMYHRCPKFNLVYCSLYWAELWNSEIAGQPEVQIIRHWVLEIAPFRMRNGLEFQSNLPILGRLA